MSESGLLEQVFDARAMTIEAHPERLHDAREWAHRVAVAAGLEETHCFEVKLAMSEAVSNAIEHGSEDHADAIELEAFKDDCTLVFEVRDTGTEPVPPVARATSDDESGRGLELLTMIMDEVQLTSSGGGSILRFAKRIA